MTNSKRVQKRTESAIVIDFLEGDRKCSSYKLQVEGCSILESYSGFILLRNFLQLCRQGCFTTEANDGVVQGSEVSSLSISLLQKSRGKTLSEMNLSFWWTGTLSALMIIGITFSRRYFVIATKYHDHHHHHHRQCHHHHHHHHQVYKSECFFLLPKLLAPAWQRCLVSKINAILRL